MFPPFPAQEVVLAVSHYPLRLQLPSSRSKNTQPAAGHFLNVLFSCHGLYHIHAVLFTPLILPAQQRVGKLLQSLNGLARAALRASGGLAQRGHRLIGQPFGRFKRVRVRAFFL